MIEELSRNLPNKMDYDSIEVFTTTNSGYNNGHGVGHYQNRH